jgi:hypothetical protein
MTTAAAAATVKATYLLRLPTVRSPPSLEPIPAKQVDTLVHRVLRPFSLGLC